MNTLPTYQAATAGYVGNAGHVNQFVASHVAALIYQGDPSSSETTGTAVYSDTYTQWLAQSFVQPLTDDTVAYFLLQLSTVNGSPLTEVFSPLVVGIYADDGGGLPTGSAISSVSLLETYVYSSPFWVTVTIVTTGLTPGATYHVVTQRVGDTGGYYVWQQSDQTSGASTSPDGITWTASTYGLLYQVFNSSTSGPLTVISEDDNARVIQFTYNPSGTINQVVEITNAQMPGGELVSTRTLTYSGNALVGVN